MSAIDTATGETRDEPASTEVRLAPSNLAEQWGGALIGLALPIGLALAWRRLRSSPVSRKAV